MTYSNIFEKEYDESKTVRIVNTKQAGKYIANHLRPVDIYWSKETLVFVFDREATRSLFQKWCRHLL